MLPPLRLLQVRASNYKAFEQPFELDLAPLTLLFGRNGSGKSALVRLALGLAEALGGGDSPGLPLRVGDISLGNSLLGFVHGAVSNGEYGIGATVLGGEGQPLHLDVLVRKDPRTTLRLPGQWIERWSLRAGDDELETFSWNRTDKRYNGSLHPEHAAPATFAGLLPVSADGGFHPLVARLRPTPQVIHIGAARGIPGEDFIVQQPKVTLDVGSTGLHTRRVLGALRTHPRPEILQAIVEMVRACFNFDLRVEEVAQGPIQGTILEAKPCGRSTWLPLAEIGTGLSHALPMFVQYALAAHPGEESPSPSLLICEEPEAHAHPQIQARIADIILQTVRSGHCTTLVETHSETLVLRIRRRIAEGFPPDKVAIYWVDDEQATTQVRRLHLDERGNVEDWPEGWFDSAMHEVSAIHRALGRL